MDWWQLCALLRLSLKDFRESTQLHPSTSHTQPFLFPFTPSHYSPPPPQLKLSRLGQKLSALQECTLCKTCASHKAEEISILQHSGFPTTEQGFNECCSNQSAKGGDFLKFSLILDGLLLFYFYSFPCSLPPSRCHPLPTSKPPLGVGKAGTTSSGFLFIGRCLARAQCYVHSKGCMLLFLSGPTCRSQHGPDINQGDVMLQNLLVCCRVSFSLAVS